MNRQKIYHKWVLNACLVFWGITLSILLGNSFTDNRSFIFVFLPLPLFVAIILTFFSVFIFISSHATKNTRREEYTFSPLAKTLAGLIIVAITLSISTAIKSLWYISSNENFGDKFVFENLATISGIAGIILTILLSATQKDIYWITRKKTILLDERQLQDRREVFEISYKLGAYIVLIAVLWLNEKIHNLTEIINNSNGSVPGHLYWIGINLALTIFALPLIVAAWKKKNYK